MAHIVERVTASLEKLGGRAGMVTEPEDRECAHHTTSYPNKKKREGKKFTDWGKPSQIAGVVGGKGETHRGNAAQIKETSW